MRSSNPQPFAPATESPRDLTVIVWPLRQHPLRMALTGLGALCVGWLSYYRSGHIEMGGLAVLALAVCGWRLWIPTVFVLGPLGINYGVFGQKRRLPWQAIARCEAWPDGVLLLPEGNPQPLASYRGLYIACTTQREQVMQFVTHHIHARGVSWTSDVVRVGRPR